MDPGQLRKEAEERELKETLKLVDGCIERLERLEAETGALEGPRCRRLKRAYEAAARELDRRLRKLR